MEISFSMLASFPHVCFSLAAESRSSQGQGLVLCAALFVMVLLALMLVVISISGMDICTKYLQRVGNSQYVAMAEACVKKRANVCARYLQRMGNSQCVAMMVPCIKKKENVCTNYLPRMTNNQYVTRMVACVKKRANVCTNYLQRMKNNQQVAVMVACIKKRASRAKDMLQCIHCKRSFIEYMEKAKRVRHLPHHRQSKSSLYDALIYVEAEVPTCPTSTLTRSMDSHFTCSVRSISSHDTDTHSPPEVPPRSVKSMLLSDGSLTPRTLCTAEVYQPPSQKTRTHGLTEVKALEFEPIDEAIYCKVLPPTN